ncbi:hypothetical protein [Deinococcus sp.]|uniref:hypothetical protein n=1 Tax=Deinococcus sp. TaxID=47478 RepID=UPI003C7DE9DD
MPQNSKQVVQTRLKALGMTQVQLAKQLGTTPAILSRTLGSPMVRQDSHWPAILRALSLDVTLQLNGTGEADEREV